MADTDDTPALTQRLSDPSQPVDGAAAAVSLANVAFAGMPQRHGSLADYGDGGSSSSLIGGAPAKAPAKAPKADPAS